MVKLIKGDAVKIVSSPELVERLLADGWVVAQDEQEAPVKRVKKA